MDDPMAIRDIAPLIESLPGASAWFWILFLMAASFIFYKYSWKAEQIATSAPPPPPTALQIALLALDTLLAEQLIENGQTKLYFTKLNMILRVFLMNQFDVQAPLQTTAELINSDTCMVSINDDAMKLFTSFLRECDLFKFADIKAQSEIARKAHDRCKDLVSTIASKKEVV